MASKIKILITDGNYKHTLAIVRSLGKVEREYDLTLSSHHAYFLSKFSRYCHNTLPCPDPVNQFDVYTEWLRSLYYKGTYQIIMPVGSESNLAVSKIEPEVVQKCSLVPPPELTQMASNKLTTVERLSQLGVRVPRTILLKKPDQIENAYAQLSRDMVIKPIQGSSAMNVIYVDNQAKLAEASAFLKEAKSSGFIAQEKISGIGRGYFGLYDRGKRLAHFMHERLREHPLSGGISVVAKSIKDKKLFELGDQIFGKLGWNGVGMLEFKHDPDTREYVLIEINPKFWGSLELAIVSGVDFPSLLVRHILGESFTEPNYQDDITFKWILPWSVLNLISRLKGKSIGHYAKGQKGYYNDISGNDILPFFFQLAILPYQIHKEWKRL